LVSGDVGGAPVEDVGTEETLVKKRRNRQPARQPWGPTKTALGRRTLPTLRS
jgi:hypothetical protein